MKTVDPSILKTNASIDLSAAYLGKGVEYFAGARRSFVNALPVNGDGRLLEIGCGTGSTAALALKEGKCGWCCGVELCEGPAEVATGLLHRVFIGDIEKLRLDIPAGSIDVLLLSEVLEHLRDPGGVLHKLRPLMRPGAVVLAGSPNVCHYSVLWMLLQGKWEYQCEGIMDETHIRWFSATSYRQLFERAGYVVDRVGPARSLRFKARLANAVLLRRFEYLFYTQLELRAHCP